MIERPQWYRPSATVRAGFALLPMQALFVSSRPERPEGSTDPSGGFKLSLVSGA